MARAGSPPTMTSRWPSATGGGGGGEFGGDGGDHFVGRRRRPSRGRPVRACGEEDVGGVGGADATDPNDHVGGVRLGRHGPGTRAFPLPGPADRDALHASAGGGRARRGRSAIGAWCGGGGCGPIGWSRYSLPVWGEAILRSHGRVRRQCFPLLGSELGQGEERFRLSQPAAAVPSVAGLAVQSQVSSRVRCPLGGRSLTSWMSGVRHRKGVRGVGLKGVW